ncbi:TolC family protein [Gimesia sp.]|uniref:TolC family protein n=1 Tax=Gimesia sp. TaxID=2024833 RepID=UPI000C3F5531|nr:TolC family protein [Gimesia sp.]MAX35634.1 transporter [Gimesia sp.]HBL46610.1 TolC family protein [Planctomycetaceae bacterium]
MIHLRLIRLCMVLPCSCLVSCAHFSESQVSDHKTPASIDVVQTEDKPQTSKRSAQKQTTKSTRPTETPEPKVADSPVSPQQEEDILIPLEDIFHENDQLLQTGFQSKSTTIPPAPAAGSGTDSPAEPDLIGMTLDLESLLQMALDSNPTLAEATAVVYKAEGIKTQVGLRPNPVIGYSGVEIGDDGRGGQQGAFFSQTYVRGNKLQLNQDVAHHDVQSLSWELEAQRFRVTNDVKSQFYATLGAQKRLEITLKLEKVAEAGVEIAQSLYKAGQAAQPDILQAEVQLGEVRILRQNAEYDLESAKQQLASLVGHDDLSYYSFTGKLDVDTVKWDWDEAYSNLVTNSPEIQAACARVNRARAQISRQEVQAIPNVQTQIGAAHDNATGSEIANVQIGLPIPIFNRNQGNIDTANSEYHRAVKDVERLQLSLKVELSKAYRDYKKALKQVERYQADILPRAQKNLDLTTQGYESQQFDFLRVLTARRTYFETNISYVNSLISLRQSEVSVNGMVLSGGLNDVRDISQGVGGTSNRGQALSGQ